MNRILLSFAIGCSIALASCGGSSDKQAQATDSIVADAAAEAILPDSAAAATDNGAVTELQAGQSVNPETLPVVVDFNATWCGPCKAFAPTFHEVAAEYAGKAVFMSADVDVCTELAEANNVKSIPNVIIFYPASANRQNVSHEGRMTKEEFTAFLDKNL